MSYIENVEKLLSDIAGARPGHIAYATTAFRSLDRRQMVECVFDFEPRLRYARYITSFNRLINNTTNFDFDVAFMQRHCIHVGYYAQDFDESAKNLVRRQVLKLIKDFDVMEEFHITELTIFEKHKYVSPNPLQQRAEEHARSQGD